MTELGLQHLRIALSVTEKLFSNQNSKVADFVCRMRTESMISYSKYSRVDLIDYILLATVYAVVIFAVFDLQSIVSMSCALLKSLGSVLQYLFFGELRVPEDNQGKDRLWNYVFYKFIFIFGVLNVSRVKAQYIILRQEITLLLFTVSKSREVHIPWPRSQYTSLLTYYSNNMNVCLLYY